MSRKQRFKFGNFGARNFMDDEGQSGAIDNDKLYELLETDKSATTAEIKKAYRKVAMKKHPDKGGDAEEFKLVNEAYGILSDEEKRKAYDKYGMEGVKDGAPARTGGFDDIFSAFFGGGSRGRQERQQPTTKSTN